MMMVKVKVKDNDVDERHTETQTDWMHARSTRAQGIQWECGIARIFFSNVGTTKNLAYS